MSLRKGWTVAGVVIVIGIISTVVEMPSKVEQAWFAIVGKPDPSLRDTTFNNVMKAADQSAEHPDQAYRLFSALEVAARELHAGSLTKEDGEQLGTLLEGVKSLKGRPQICQTWAAMPDSVKSQPNLANLVGKAIDYTKC